jgi:hypothetical protein
MQLLERYVIVIISRRLVQLRSFTGSNMSLNSSLRCTPMKLLTEFSEIWQ